MKKLLAVILLTTFITAVGLPVFANAEDNVADNRLEQNIFVDVSVSEWYADSVLQANERAIMRGIGSRTFAPDIFLTREMAVTVLYRMEFGDSAHMDEVNSKYKDVELPYDDVVSNSWYVPALLWATEMEITNGIGDSLFGIGKPITREELTAMIDRYLTSKSLGLMKKVHDIPKFNDEEDVSDWAAESLEVLCYGGVITGDDKGNFRPKDHVTRAEAAVVFVRLDDAFEFEISYLLDFEDDEVGVITFSLFNRGETVEIKKTDTKEIKAILTILRGINISYSRTHASVNTGGGGHTLTILDKNGEYLFGIFFSPDSFYDSGVRVYVFDDTYLQDIYDVLDQADPK